MANPQREDGHIRIANKIAEKFRCYRLSGQEWQILWTILRETWGWRKKMDTISHTDFAKLTGISRRHIWKIIKGLIEKDIILRTITQKGDSIVVNYGIQKNYEKWKVSRKKVIGESVTQKGDRSVTQKGDRSVTQKGDTLYIKERKERKKVAFRVISYLNNKTKKNFRPTETNQAQIAARLAENYTEEDLKKVIDIKFEDSHFQENPKYMNPTTLFRKSKFDNYLNEKPPVKKIGAAGREL